jgi:hypothetical protein
LRQSKRGEILILNKKDKNNNVQQKEQGNPECKRKVPELEVKHKERSNRLNKRSKTIGQVRKVEQKVGQKEWNNKSNKKSRATS